MWGLIFFFFRVYTLQGNKEGGHKAKDVSLPFLTVAKDNEPGGDSFCLSNTLWLPIGNRSQWCLRFASVPRCRKIEEKVNKQTERNRNGFERARKAKESRNKSDDETLFRSNSRVLSVGKRAKMQENKTTIVQIYMRYAMHASHPAWLGVTLTPPSILGWDLAIRVP